MSESTRQDDDQRALLDFLGIRPPSLLDDRVAKVPQVDTAMVRALRARLEADPQTVLDHAPAILGRSPTVDDVRRVLLEAERALERPRATLEALRVTLVDGEQYGPLGESLSLTSRASPVALQKYGSLASRAPIDWTG